MFLFDSYSRTLTSGKLFWLLLLLSQLVQSNTSTKKFVLKACLELCFEGVTLHPKHSIIKKYLKKLELRES